MKFNPILALPPAIFGGFLIFAFLGLGGEKGFEGRQGAIAPDLFVEPLADMAEIRHEDLTTGGVKLVNFWASWCAPCRAEHPQLETLAKDGVTIYGVNYKDEDMKALRFLDELGNPYAALMADKKGRTGLDWGLYGVPETFVIDKDGVIIKRFAGPITESVLDSVIRPAIAEAAAK